MRSLRVLNIEDSVRDHELFRRYMTSNGVELTVDRVETPAAMELALADREWDVIICDYSMPSFSAPEALKLLHRVGLDIPFIIISGTVGEEEAVRAMKAGANDYLMKDNLTRLLPAIEREIQEAENRRARRKAEESLRKSEAELRALFAAMNDVVFVLDRDGRHLKTAPSISNYPAKPADELAGKTLRECYDSETAELILANVGRALDEDRTLRFEYRQGADGDGIWYEASVSPVSKNTVIVVARDITDRRRSEAKIAESERQLAEAQSLARVGNWNWNLETGALSWSDEHYHIFGLNPRMFELTYESILSKHIHKEDRELVERTIRDSLDNIKPFDFHYRIVLTDGSVRYVHSIGHVVCSKEGTPGRMFGTSQDVTERMRSEAELIKSEERYRDLVENAHDIIYSHDLSGNYTSINEAGERITGYSRDEALRMNISDTVAPEFIDIAREMIGAKLRGEDTTAYELEVLAKDGRRIWVEVNTKLILHDGVPVGVQGIARDITSRKQLEEQLRQAQKLESVGRLAGGIAHDFNNMLTAITGYSELALRQLPDDHRVRRNIEEIKKAGDRSTLLTNQLLAFSRRQLLRPEVIDLNDVITDTTGMLQRVIGEDIELITELCPHAVNVNADKGQLSQIIMNLAINARDAMPNGGKLKIATSQAFVDPEYARAYPELVPGSYVKLSVSDNGTGINESDFEHIFEPFFTTKEVGKGTGLGLSTVYGIVKQSGGSISVESEVGSGTTFEVLLPGVRAKEAESALESIRDERLPIGPETILLVEDEELVRSFLTELLEACGYRVIATTDGESALAICKNTKEPIDLLITDVVMPRMSGRELAEKLGAYLPKLPVLFISGYTDDALVRESVLDSDVNFIQKPFTIEIISKKVRQVIDAGLPDRR